jgi:hypothetical protein
MTQLQRVDDLEIEQDLAFQKRIWCVQRIGWVLIALILAAALLGLFGSGPLSRAEVSTPDGAVQLSYSRFARALAPMRMRLTVQPGLATEDLVEFSLNRQYLHDIKIEQINPEPDMALAAAEGIRYRFQTTANTPLVAEFYLEAQQFGLVRGQLTVTGQAPLSFWHFVYP